MSRLPSDSREPVALPTLSGIEEAQRRIERHQRATPLVRSELLSRALDAEIWLKNETVSPIGCFKLRGALTDLSRARESRHVAAAVTSSTGNHGQGVALAARLLALPAHIFLPIGANPQKRQAIAALGATIHEVGDDIDVAKHAARAFAVAEGFHFVDDGESVHVIEGNGTVGLEIAGAMPRVDYAFIPMGSGSLAAGCGAALHAARAKTRVIAVQAEGAPAMAKSFAARRAVHHPIATLADGLVCREPAELALQAILQHVDEALVVSEEALLRAMHTLAIHGHVLSEPSGAATLAAVFNERVRLRGSVVVLVVSGANVQREVLARALAAPPLMALDQEPSGGAS